MSGGAPIRALIVDDEPLARAVLREYLAPHADIEIVGVCGNGFEAVKAIESLQPDLLFLDIQMPKLDGFEVLELIDREVAVVFVTAYDQHALRAFEVRALDYLLKPFSPERLAEAVAHVRERLRGEDAGAAIGANARALAAEARPEGKALERVVIKDDAAVHVIPVGDIDYIEALDDYIGIHAGGKKLLKQQTMAEIESALDAARFVRIHRSYLLNLDRLSRLEPYAKDSRVAVLKSGAQLPVSRAGYARLKELM